VNYTELFTYFFTNDRCFQSVNSLTEIRNVRLSFLACVYPLLVQIQTLVLYELIDRFCKTQKNNPTKIESVSIQESEITTNSICDNVKVVIVFETIEMEIKTS
jgi:hypothetical protein